MIFSLSAGGIQKLKILYKYFIIFLTCCYFTSLQAHCFATYPAMASYGSFHVNEEEDDVMNQDYEAQKFGENEVLRNVSAPSSSTKKGLVLLALVAIGTFAITSYGSSSTTTSTSLGKVSSGVKKDIFDLPPDITDPVAMHDFIKNNYLLYSGISGNMATSKTQPKAKDDPNRTPETAKGAREAKKEEIVGNDYLYIEAYTDANCITSSFQGFMAFKINTCTPAWMFSSDEQRLWLRNQGEVKETKIITQTDLFSDASCTNSVSIKPVNQTNNQACGAWNSEGNIFVKFALKETISLDDYGSGVLIQSHADDDCKDDATEILYLVSREGECQGRFQGVCGDDDVSLARFNDYGCQGGKTDGYPMSFTKTCGYENSIGFSKYGMATCNTAEAPAQILTVEASQKFVGTQFKEADLSKSAQKKIAKLQKKLEKAEKKGDDKLISKLEKKIVKAGGKVADEDEDEDEEVSAEVEEVMVRAALALKTEVADKMDVDPKNVEIIGSHYDTKGNNGFVIKYQVTGLEEKDLEDAADAASSKSLAKKIQKAMKKDGITGFDVSPAEASVSELVPDLTDFYAAQVLAAATAVGHTTAISEEAHDLVPFDETAVYDERTESQPLHDGSSEEENEEAWAAAESGASKSDAKVVTTSTATTHNPVASAVSATATTTTTTTEPVEDTLGGGMFSFDSSSTSSSSSSSSSRSSSASSSKTVQASGPTAQKASSTASTSSTSSTAATDAAKASADAAKMAAMASAQMMTSSATTVATATTASSATGLRQAAGGASKANQATATAPIAQHTSPLTTTASS